MRNVFVFGSNLAGRHGKGAALEAKQRHGAVPGQGRGLMNNCYAIPTKGYQMQPLPLDLIKVEVEEFLNFARDHESDFKFHVTPIGCGLAGYLPVDIAPFFRDAPGNVVLPAEFRKLLEGIER